MRRLVTYEFDDRPEASPFSPAIRHLVDEREPLGDATVCGEYIDTNWGDKSDSWEFCAVCTSMADTRDLLEARKFVARELGVDESEVF